MKQKRNLILIGVTVLLIALAAITVRPHETDAGNEASNFRSISMDEAAEVFQKDGDYIILDVRREDEYASGHIPGAINISNEEIGDAETETLTALPDKNQTIYVYCRSGNRSKQASAKLAAMGYTNIVEFGGIQNWSGEMEK